MNIFLTTLLMMLSANSYAALKVVSVDGATVDSTSYLSSYNDRTLGIAQQNVYEILKANMQNLPIEVNTMLYPVTSQLTVGQVKTEEFTSSHLAHPIFVIGDDPVSIQWAISHAVALKRLGAWGMVTNVKDQDRVSAIEKSTGLTLTPASLDGIEPLIHTTHYPFLWTVTGVSQ